MSNRKDYHNACKAEKSTANQVNNMRSDDSVALDTVSTNVWVNELNDCKDVLESLVLMDREFEISQ